MQKIKEEERRVVYDHFYCKEKDIVTGVVQRYVGENVSVSLDDKTDALLMKSEQIRGEVFKPTERIKLYIVEVKETNRGTVEIKNIVREAGSRTKMAVWSNDKNVDPVGACVGLNGARVNAIVNDLKGEKIDIINWNENPALLIENALSPAKVVVVLADVEEKTAKVVVPDYQLSLAIGKEGQNARLAARLTGFKIDIKSESQANAIEGFYEGFYDEDEDEEEAYDENEYAEGTVEDENAEE